MVAKIRCAIYTRKSSEEGLDQSFNSLDAQHEACAAYIASQRHEGWRLSQERYDDGGISGGTLERPGLQRLLNDIDDGQIDLVVVYKIDRLTRSLHDFAKLVDRLDAASCSFVSVTQAFNTSTSMGRLTLNVLLSFAQFEREVTAERIRDKIAASKKKGMWMGGLTPLGYDHARRDGQSGLVINTNEADAVRAIFRAYDQTPHLPTVRDQTIKLGITSKHRIFASGRQQGGSLLSNGQIHFILTNPVYIGKIRHKKEIYNGLHASIIDQSLFDRVQTKLHAASVNGSHSNRAGQKRARLISKLFDETGDRLTPSFTCLKSRRIFYYVSNRLIRRQEKDPTGWRLPARPLEEAIANAVQTHIKTTDAHLIADPTAEEYRLVTSLTPKLLDQDTALKLIERVVVAPGQLTIQLNPTQLAELLKLRSGRVDPDKMSFTQTFTLKRRGVEQKIISGAITHNPDSKLIRAIAQAHEWLDLIKQGTTLKEIARAQNTTDAPIRRRLKLAFLSPKITRMILDGQQPISLTIRQLIRMNIPMCWENQEKMVEELR